MADRTLRKESALTQAQLRELLNYNPETGEFTYRSDVGNHVRAGCRAGTRMRAKPGQHYIRIFIRGHAYYAHRLAFLYMLGEWPSDQVDHIDGDGTNNRWSNLRAATHRQNNANKVLRRDSKIGLKGVSRAGPNHFQATIRVDGKRRYLGCFRCPKEAHEAYKAAAEKYFAEFSLSRSRDEGRR